MKLTHKQILAFELLGNSPVIKSSKHIVSTRFFGSYKIQLINGTWFGVSNMTKASHHLLSEIRNYEVEP